LGWCGFDSNQSLKILQVLKNSPSLKTIKEFYIWKWNWDELENVQEFANLLAMAPSLKNVYMYD